jgi:hypothetical protein
MSRNHMRNEAMTEAQRQVFEEVRESTHYREIPKFRQQMDWLEAQAAQDPCRWDSSALMDEALLTALRVEKELAA